MHPNQDGRKEHTVYLSFSSAPEPGCASVHPGDSALYAPKHWLLYAGLFSFSFPILPSSVPEGLMAP